MRLDVARSSTGTPIGDHRERIGDVDTLEALTPEHGRLEARCIGLGHGDAAEMVAGERALRRFQHGGRDVEAIERRRRIAPCHGDEVTPRAAADLEYRIAGAWLDRGDQPIAAEQVIFAREIVDMALVAIDPIHGLGSLGCILGGLGRHSDLWLRAQWTVLNS